MKKLTEVPSALGERWQDPWVSHPQPPLRLPLCLVSPSVTMLCCRLARHMGRCLGLLGPRPFMPVPQLQASGSGQGLGAPGPSTCHARAAISVIFVFRPRF